MSHKYSILVVDDEINTGNYLAAAFSANQYHVLRARDGAEALMMITSYCPDLITLELALPDTDGVRIIKSVREWSQVPIIVVSSKTHERTKVEALDMGADDYITKPFGISELLARVRAAFRHVKSRDANEAISAGGKFTAGSLTVDFDKRHAYIDGKDVFLTQNEFKIVALLAKYPGRVLTYDYLKKAIWGPKVDSDNQILRVNMANIRKKLEKNPAEPEYIFTETGVGYRMLEES